MNSNSNLSYRDVIKLFGNIDLSVRSMDELWDQLVRKFTDTGLCEDMKVGRLEITITIESSLYGAYDSDEYFTYDSGRPCNESAVASQTYSTVDKGVGRVDAYPLEGMEFDAEDIEVLLGFGNIIHLMMTRVRFAINAEKSKYMDLMTGLYNTPGIRMEGKKAEAVGELNSKAVIFINLRDFTSVNKRIGIKNGDQVIVRFAKLLHTLSTMNSGKAARLGGDKFLLIVPKSQLDSALSILSSVTIDIQILDHTENVVLTAWIGVCITAETDGIEEAMETASKACEQAHRSGATEPVIASSTFTSETSC